VSDKRSDFPCPYVRGDLPAYRSPVTGRVVDGRAARREDLARTGCREVEPSEYEPTFSSEKHAEREWALARKRRA
jgi:hypothetical protein